MPEYKVTQYSTGNVIREGDTIQYGGKVGLFWRVSKAPTNLDSGLVVVNGAEDYASAWGLAVQTMDQLHVFVSDDGKSILHDPKLHGDYSEMREPIFEITRENPNAANWQYRRYTLRTIGGLTTEQVDAARQSPEFLHQLIVQAGLIDAEPSPT